MSKKTLLLSLKEVEDLVEEERLVLYRHSVVNAPLLIIIMEGKRWASLRRRHDNNYHYKRPLNHVHQSDYSAHV